MLIISQNATDYDLNFPKDAILRINLAWCNSLDELEIILKKNIPKKFKKIAIY